jgi:TonB-dependent starch-binding outer membrane protein SusC
MKQKIKFVWLVLFVLALINQNLFAQSKITGTVKEANGTGLPGVTVSQLNTKNGVVTDVQGKYSLTLTADAPQSLVFTFMGFLKQTVSFTGNSIINVVLKEDQVALNEVVVVGYTSQKKSSITGAVSTVNMGDLTKTRIADVAQALQGQVSGVFVSANTGAPGDGIKVRIRGEGTLGNNEVLYVVDGVSTRDISFLSPSDIKSMTVLKDAAATAIYGSRASGGVVVITTNSGQKGKTNIDFDYFSGIYNANNLPEMLNTDQYLAVKDRAWHNSLGNSATDISPYAADRSRADLANTNWLNELFTTGKSQNFQASASGGSDKFQYLLSAGYFGQDGIVISDNDKYRRLNLRTNLNADVSDRFKLGTNLQLTYSTQDKIASSGESVIRYAVLRTPVVSVFKSPTDPTYSESDPYTDLPFYLNNNSNGGWSKNYEFVGNPIAFVNYTDDKRNTYQTFGNVFGEYAFLKGNTLKFRSNVGADISFSHNKRFAENFGDDNDNDPGELYPGMGRNNRPNNLDENRDEVMTFTFSNTLNYVNTFRDKHSLNALLGTEYISKKTSGLGGSRQNFDNTTNPFRYLEYGADPNQGSAGSASESTLLSFFASETYGYANKYFLTSTIRADASSRFGPNNKWSYFPSVSAGWKISDENFMKDFNWLSNFQLRASWGKSGNQEIPNYAYETVVTQVGGVPNIIRYGNPDLKWETTAQTNFGFDLAVLNNKLSLSADYFVKKTTDIILPVGLPAVSVGVIDRTFINAGQVNNKGLEFGLNYRNDEHAFRYGANANLATLTNKVEKLYTFLPNILDDATRTRTEAGQPISSYYGYVFGGIYQNTSEVSSHLFSNSNGSLPGDIKFKDLNADGQINANDRAFIGNPIPKITYGFAFSSEYRNFDFSFLLQGVQDVDRYNDMKQILNYDTRAFNSTTDVLKSWNGEGTSNTMPRLSLNNNGGGNVSSVFVEDASYFRLKNIELGYTFQASRLGVKNLRLYASGQNVFTSTKYSGLDPESTSLIDKGTYPQSTAFIFGVRVKL